MKFSVVVPTTDRPDTLVHTLRTIVEQNDVNYEIVVIDNAGPLENKRIVDSFSRPDLFVYHRNDERVRMSDNWEIGISKSTGDYITYVGDDDGLVVNSISIAREAILKSNAKILFWWPHMYWWPTALLENKKSLLYAFRGLKNINVVESNQFIDQFFSEYSSIWNFERLPSIYNSFVSREVIDHGVNQVGKYFNDEIPDLYSGVLNALLVSNLCFIEWPLSIRGLSHHSNGVAFRSKKDNKISSEFFDLAKQEIISDKLVDSRTISIGITSFKIRMIEKFNARLGSYKININNLISEMINEMAEGQSREAEIKNDIINLCNKYEIPLNFLEKIPYNFPEPDKIWGWKSDNQITVNTKLIQIDDIYAARQLLHAMMGG